jgi:MFS family permease
VWGATVISNIGGWMYSAASGWLMTDLNPDPFIVSMVQAATTLPIFLFALPAGALADIVDRRKFLIVVEVLYTTVAAIFAAIVWIGAATPGNLLLFTFLMGVGAALTAPVWQSIVPQLVPRQDLSPAVAANSVGVNVSRAVGPALGGLMVARIGIASPFCSMRSAISQSSVRFFGGTRRKREHACRSSGSAVRFASGFATRGTIPICGQPWFELLLSFCSQAPIGHSFHWSRALRLPVVQTCMATS